jgi:hypothetical protein
MLSGLITFVSDIQMLSEKLTPYHNFITKKPDSTQNSNNIREYTENLGKSNINTVDKTCPYNVKYSGCADYNPYFRGSVCSTLTSPLSKYSPIKASDHLANKSGEILNCPGVNVLTIPNTNKTGNGLTCPCATY